MLSDLKNANKVTGAKQVTRALRNGSAALVFLAEDADPALTEPVERLALEQGIPITRVRSMKELGQACGISVGSAVAAILA